MHASKLVCVDYTAEQGRQEPPVTSIRVHGTCQPASLAPRRLDKGWCSRPAIALAAIQRAPSSAPTVPAPCCRAARRRVLSLVRMGVQCSLAQLLVTGVMHGDPHSGNLLLRKVRRGWGAGPALPLPLPPSSLPPCRCRCRRYRCSPAVALPPPRFRFCCRLDAGHAADS